MKNEQQEKINTLHYNIIIAMLWVLGATIHLPIMIITPLALVACLGVLFADYYTSLDINGKKKLLKVITSIFGFVVAVATAGGVINPLISFVLYLGASATLANILTYAVFILIIPAWFALYTIGKDQMIGFVFKTLIPEKDSQQKKEAKSFIPNFLGFANAIFANGTGLVLGSVGFLNLFPAAYSSIFILQMIAISLGYVGGVLAAASLTRESLIKVYDKITSGKSSMKSFETTLCIITGFALASFNFKAGSEFITTIVNVLHITTNPALLNFMGFSLGVICLVLTVFAASALLLNLNEAFDEKDEKDEKEIFERFKKFNLQGFIGKLIPFFSFIGSAVGGLMIYDALINSLPATGLISLSTLVYLSAIVSILFLIKEFCETDSKKIPILGCSILTTTLSCLLLFSSNIAPIIFGAAIVLSVIASYTFFKMYTTGFKLCALRLMNTSYIQQFSDNYVEKENSANLTTQNINIIIINSFKAEFPSYKHAEAQISNEL